VSDRRRKGGGPRDGSKPTFAERDKRRREGRGGQRDAGAAGTTQSHAQKSYRAALERAFESGRIDEFAATVMRTRDPAPAGRPAAPAKPPPAPEPSADAGPDGAPPPPAPPPAAPAVDPARAERRKLLAQIRDAAGPDDLSRAIDRFRSRCGELPDDFEILERALGHRDPDTVRDALRRLEAKLAKGAPRRSRSLAMQLAILSDTHADDEIRELAARIREGL
jgi:hypothetical protein